MPKEIPIQEPSTLVIVDLEKWKDIIIELGLYLIYIKNQICTFLIFYIYNQISNINKINKYNRIER